MKVKEKNCTYIVLSVILTFSIFIEGIQGQAVVQSRGVDQAVDYESLKDFGPWDDRNYQLTASDISLLAPNEAELREPIPAFYRVILRKRFPELRRTGRPQYPRSALPRFNIEYTGYQIDGNHYRGVVVENGKFRVLTDEPVRGEYDGTYNNRAATEVRVTNPNGAAESAIKIHPFDPNIVIAGTNGPGGGQKMHFSHDGGLTWTQVDLPLGGTCCDPTVDYSSDGAFAYASTLGNGVYFYRSSDNGVTWTDLESITPGDPRREFGVGFSDKQYLHVDKACNSPFKDNLYMTWHEGNTMQFARSTDMGNTWQPKISFNSDPSGIGSDICTDAAGNIYYIYSDVDNGQILLKKSTDGGVTFQNGNILVGDTEGNFDFAIPVMDTRRVFIYTSVDSDFSSSQYSGSIYAAWTDSTAPEQGNPVNNHARIRVAYSRDQGATWTVVTPHSTADANTVDRFHQWLAVDLSGNVHVVFYDTRNSANRNGVDFYHTMSTDGAQTFSAPERLTTVTSPEINNGFEWGDYNGLDHVVRQSTIFTDNRSEGGGGGDSDDVYSTTELQGGMNISQGPGQPSAILGPTTVCVGQDNIPYEAAVTPGAETFDFTFSDPGVTVTPNPNNSALVSLTGVGPAGGTLSVTASNVCGTSPAQTLVITVASTAVCDVVNCMVNNLSIDDPTIATADVFDIIQTINSDATVLTGTSKIFRAANSIEMMEGFSVEQSTFFIAQIEDCAASAQGGGK